MLANKLISCFIIAALAYFVIAQECPEVDPEEPIYMPHENNCSKFYQCSNGDKLEMECPPGQHFNPILRICDWESDAGCEDYMTSTAGSIRFFNDDEQEQEQEENSVLVDSDEEDKDANANITTPACEDYDEVVHFPHEECDRYYQCANGELIERECPPGLHFHPELKVCDFPKNVHCERK